MEQASILVFNFHLVNGYENLKDGRDSSFILQLCYQFIVLRIELSVRQCLIIVLTKTMVTRFLGCFRLFLCIIIVNCPSGLDFFTILFHTSRPSYTLRYIMV